MQANPPGLTAGKQLLMPSLLWLLTACPVMLVGSYDQVTDESIQKLQDQVSLVMVRIERNFDGGEPAANEYVHFRDHYEKMAASMLSLQNRCQAIPKYGIVCDQLSLLDSNLRNLEKYHKTGFRSREELAPIKMAFERQFGAMIALQNALKRKKNS